MDGAGTARVDALVEEATVDCYGEEEQLTGLYTMIEGGSTRVAVIISPMLMYRWRVSLV